ncbi:ATP-grasp domain-containing protein [Zavarzinia sp.]|uniref:ATP-grasp domain-containing protein n=1 Tax=Zavarzinia sp. TaxID=2027920 RepID=UPI0035672512
MKLYEHEAKRVLAGEGLAVPRRYGVARTPAAARKLRIKYPAMVKAQVLIGGRGKAGGIRRVESDTDTATAAADLLAMRIRGHAVESVLIEAAAESSGGCYLGVTANPATFNNVVIASASGGVDIEEVARTRPDAILRVELPDSPDTLPAESARQVASFLAKDLGGSPELEEQLADIATKLYLAYQKYDCKVLEINPLLITPQGPLAADAKMVLDDNALYRQAELLERLGIKARRHEVAEPTARERRARDGGFPYVDLLPEDAVREPGKIYVGLVPGGAGYGIFSIDEVTGIGQKLHESRVVPVNFMDSGGGPTREGVAEMFALLMEHPLVDVIITSRFGGISSCDIFIRGLVDCLRERRAARKRIVPVYGRMVGTDLAAARAFLEAARRETPEALEPLSMVVGNREIMADVIRDGLAAFLASTQETAR